LGRKLGRDTLTIYDDEGVCTGKTVLVEDGVLVGRLHSRETAGIMGEKPTGNARALNYTFPPLVRMRNTCIAPGNSAFEDMIKDVKLGLYAIGSGGGETNGEMFNFMAGHGFMVRDGPGGCGKGGQMPLATSGVCPAIRIRNAIVGGAK
jgi:TldD protein